MRTLVLLTITAALISANVSSAATLTDGNFETITAWAGSTATLTVNDTNASKWWYGTGTISWIRQNKADYAPLNDYCAGIADTYGTSCGLVQFVPITDETTINLSFQYLLWYGDMEPTTLDYAIVGWHKDSVINLSVNGLNGITTILNGTLTTPEYYGQGKEPRTFFESFGTSGTINPTDYDYIGIWFRYTSDGGSFYVDDVNLNITPVPEPATIALLGLGGLIIVLRRRGT